MKYIRFWFPALLVLCVFVPEVFAAGVKLPSYATGDAATQTATMGKKVTDFLGVVIGVLSTIGILSGAAMISTGLGAEMGKKVVLYSVVGAVVGGLSYGLLALVV
jgi:hypothetical protein